MTRSATICLGKAFGSSYECVGLTVIELGMILFANSCIGHTVPQHHCINLSIGHSWNPDEPAGECFHLAALLVLQ